MLNYSLPKNERVKSKQRIDALFQHGKAFFYHNLQLVILAQKLEENQETKMQIAFSAPKKYFAKAYQRNKVKRMLREAYRLQKIEIYNLFPSGKHYHAMLIAKVDANIELPTLKDNIFKLFTLATHV